MRLAAVTVVLAAGAIARAQLSNIPQCSLNCFTSALGGDGCSELTDFACHCQKPGLVDEIVPCINKACDIADQQAVSSIVVSLCAGVGHPVSVPAVSQSVPTTTVAGSVATTARSSNSTTVSGLGSNSKTSSAVSESGSSSKTSSAVSAASPQSTSQFNGASGIVSGAVQVAGSAILLTSMFFLV